MRSGYKRVGDMSHTWPCLYIVVTAGLKIIGFGGEKFEKVGFV